MQHCLCPVKTLVKLTKITESEKTEKTNKNNITLQEKPHITCQEMLLFVDTWKSERYNQIRL